jgi:hypothetical protein
MREYTVIFEMGRICDWFWLHTVRSCGGHLSLPISPHHTYDDISAREENTIANF